MSYLHTTEKNAQIIISLLKAHRIRYVIASPGNTNTALIGSIQRDPFFIIFSSVDERSAAYLACGLAAETGESVVISCTGATASRNYLSGLTEAYYRKLPVLAITSSQAVSKVGHHIAQVIDRSSIQNDVARHSVTLPIVKDADDVWDCEIKVNRAILELRRNGGGPVHINLPTTYAKPYDMPSIPKYRVINRITPEDAFPALAGRVAVFIGSHKTWMPAETKALERFAIANNAPVFCDHTSGYRGSNRLLFALVAAQEMFDLSSLCPDVLIHIGEISGDYASLKMAGKQIWRVSEDGEIRDTFRKLRYVFEMREASFFNNYASQKNSDTNDYVGQCRDLLAQVRSKIPEVPLSNIWLASKMAHRIPDGAAIHFGILNSLRAWNFFDLPPTVSSWCNVGGFGIDGCISSLIGASFTNPHRLYFGIVGDLAFFYDMNVLGNRHVGKNVRLLLINNGTGVEFKNYNHHAAIFGEDADMFVAASGHFGNKSHELVKHYAQDLGFEYFSAATKQDCEAQFQRFLEPSMTDRPIIFEIFTTPEEESAALKNLQRIEESKKSQVKQLVKNLVGRKGVDLLKKTLRS